MAYTGPITVNRGSHSLGFIHNQSIYKSLDRKQRRKPLPYSVSRFGVVGYWNMVVMEGVMSNAAGKASMDYAQTYDRFWAKVGERANLALTVLDARRSLNMISTRSLQLAKAANALRRGRFGDFARELGIQDHPKHLSRKGKLVSAGASPSSIWLEYTFGWVPLVQDIGAAVDVLQQDFNFQRVRAVTNRLFSDNQAWDGGSSRETINRTHYFIGARTRVTNPNLFLANQLGFLNPALVAWDAVPFSFVVDWFLPVNKFLTSFSNDFGIELTDIVRGHGVVTRGAFAHVAHGNGTVYYGSGTTATRVIGTLPRPTFLSRLRAPAANPWLAATSVSLAFQQLRKFTSRT